MGAQTSITSANTKVISNAINSAIMKSSKSCSGSTIQTQYILVGGDANISGSGADLSQTQKSSINLKCIQNDSFIADLRNKIKDEIKNKLKSANEGQNIGFQTTFSQTSTNLISEVANIISKDDIQECLSKVNQHQSTIIKGDLNITGDDAKLSLEQVATILSSCIQKNSNLSKSINDLATSVSNDISSNNAGFIGGGVLILILIIILIGLGMYVSGAPNVKSTNKPIGNKTIW